MEAAGISLPAFTNAPGCPFRGPFYQLMRQFLLAACLRQMGVADKVEVACLGFVRNTKLHAIPRPLQPLATQKQWGIIDTWNSVLEDVTEMRQWTVEQFMARVNKLDSVDLGWRNYLRERYDV